ncbi:site-specific integrase (plasmid) [Rhodococcus opacus]
MPVLIDDDLLFDDESGARPTVAMNRWLRELPVSGAPSPKTWLTYAQVLKGWSEFLSDRGIGAFADRARLRSGLSMYAEYRLSGPLQARWAAASWNLAVNTLAGFYRWAQAEGYVQELPFSFVRQSITRTDGMRVDVSRNLAAVRGAKPHARRKYLEQPYVELLLQELSPHPWPMRPCNRQRRHRSPIRLRRRAFRDPPARVIPFPPSPRVSRTSFFRRDHDDEINSEVGAHRDHARRRCGRGGRVPIRRNQFDRTARQRGRR